MYFLSFRLSCHKSPAADPTARSIHVKTVGELEFEEKDTFAHYLQMLQSGVLDLHTAKLLRAKTKRSDSLAIVQFAQEGALDALLQVSVWLGWVCGLV